MADAKMKRLRATLKVGSAASWLLLAGVLVFFNARLHVTSPLAAGLQQVPPNLPALLAANRSALEAGAAQEMQRLFPEGFTFSFLFHGLTHVELALRDKWHKEQALQEVAWCLAHVESEEGREVFPSDLPPDHGMFYSAWKCSLRAGLVLPQEGQDPLELERWRAECDALAEAFRRSPTPLGV